MNCLQTGKNRIMKTKLFKITVFSFILNLLFFCLGCETESSSLYTIKNESGKHIKIKVYDNGPNKEFIHEIILENNQSISKEFTDYAGNPSQFYYIFEDNTSLTMGSIAIIYNNSKINEFDFNIVNERNPIRFTSDIFIFTEEDYQNAIDCNGNCE